MKKYIVFSLLFYLAGCAKNPITIEQLIEMEQNSIQKAETTDSSVIAEEIDNILVSEKIKAAKPNSILTPGKDAQKLLAEIEKIQNIKKDEFETTSDFKNRIQKEIDKLNSKKGDIIIQANIETKYDADNNTMTFVFNKKYNDIADEAIDSTFSNKPLGNINHNCFVRSNYVEHSDKYIYNLYADIHQYYCINRNIYKISNEYDAQNGFGARAKLKETTFVNYGYILNIAPLPSIFSIKLSLEEARSLKNNVTLLIMGKIEKIGNFSSENTIHKATLNSPREILYKGYYIPIDVESICLWDNKNKKCIDGPHFYKSDF